MLTGTNLKYTKAYNYRIVLETIRLYGPLSRSDIARRSSLTTQTISNIVRELIDTELVREADKVQHGRGAPSITLEINPAGGYSIGLDFDRDHLTGVLVNLNGTVLQRIHQEVDFPAPPAAIPLMVDTTHQLIAQAALTADDIHGLGVGFPGPLTISEGSTVTNAITPKAFPGWEHVPVIDMLQAHIDLPIFMENNATAAAVGERWYGAGQHIANFFYLLFDVGLGGGIILNGHPYGGFSGNAGEMGYLPPPPSSKGDGSTHLGEYFYLPPLYERLRAAGHTARKPADLAPLFEERVDLVVDWIASLTEHLGTVLIAVECVLDPEVIFFGGRLPAAITAALIDRLGAHLPTLRTSDKSHAPCLMPATAGHDAAALGVATLPIYDVFAPAPRLLMKSANGAATNLDAAS